MIIEVFDEDKTYFFTCLTVRKGKENSSLSNTTKNNATKITQKQYYGLLNGLLYDTTTLTKYSQFFESFPKEKIAQYRKSLEDKKQKRNNFPIDRDVEK